MKKLFTKFFALMAMGIIMATPAFSQGLGGHSHTNTEEDPLYGKDWEIFHFPNFDDDGNHDGTFREVSYYNGGNFDNIKVNKLLGDHWMGRSINELEEGTELFLCNMKTHQYLQIGDYWGENSMTNHSGIVYTLQSGVPQRRVQAWEFFLNDANGYWLSAKLEGSNKADRAVGRMATLDGNRGHFEYNRFLALRSKDEYHDDEKLNDAGTAMVSGDRKANGENEAHPGAFLFHFKEVKKGGKTCYFIYTHRQTNTSGVGDKTEFGDRESYLLIRSHDKQSTGYHTVRFKKFAGAMYGKYNKYTTLTLTDKSDLNDVTYTNNIGNEDVHKYGTYANAQGGNTYTTNATSGIAGFTVTADADIIQAAKYGDNYGHTMQFKLTDQTSHTVTLTAPAGYVIAGYFMEDALTTTNGNPCYVTPAGGSQIEVGAGANATPGTKTIVSPSGLMEASTTFTIQAKNAAESNICFPKFYVYLQKLEDPINVILGDRSNTVADNDKTTRATNAHKYGTYNNADGGNTYTTNSTSGMQGVTLVADGNYMNAAYYSNENYQHTMRFHPGNEDEHTITISAPAGYYITSYNIQAITNVAQCPYIVNGTEVTSELETFSESNLYQQTVTFTIQKQKDGKDGGLCFPIINVTLAKPDETLIASTYGNNKDNPVGDEVEYHNAGRDYVTLEEGLAEAYNDDANLWRIVTAEERNRYRLVASEEHPVDMTQRLKNPKFYTAYTYTRSVNEYPTDANFTWDATKQHYNHTNGEREFGWQWFDDDRMPHKSYHHIHPYDQAYVTNTTTNPGYFDPEALIDNKPRQRELHKVGTGVYYRFHTANMDASNTGDRKQDEYYVTWGQDANYVGSMWKGSSNLVQTIGTGTPTDPKLLEGLYLVRVKGFYAPHDMMKYHKKDNAYKRWNSSFTTEDDVNAQLSTDDDWYKEAVVTSDGPDKDKGKWRRSHDSYLFAWTNPDWKSDEDPGEPKEVRRMLPSIYEGAINFDEIGDAKRNTLSKEAYLDSEEFNYTGLGRRKTESAMAFAIANMRDTTNFAVYGGQHFSSDRYSGWNFSSGNWTVPRSLIGAGRWFNIIDDMEEDESTSYANARNYLISLPVYVGKDGLLTIGVDHTFNPKDVIYTGTHDGEEYSMTIPASRPDEWVCFDDFEVIYLGKQEPDEFVLDEMNNRYGIGDPEDPDFYEYDNNTGDLKKHDSNGNDVPAKIDVGGKFVDNPAYAQAIPTPLNTAQVQNQNNTQWIDLFDPQDIATTTDFTTVKKLIVRRTLTKDGWGSIVFPMSLTGEQIRKGFGENAQVAYLTGITDFRNRRNTIQYELVDLNASGKVIQAGMPYVIKPSIDPMVAKDRYYERSKYTIAYSSKAGGVANRYLKDPDRNKEVERKIYGPLYIIEDVEIKVSEVFPEISYLSDTEAKGDGSIWPSIGGDDENRSERFGKRQVPDADTYWEIQYKPNSETFRLVETAHYEGGGTIPAYSYFHTNGQIYYTTRDLPTNKGLYSYLQLHDTTQSGEPAYSKGFLGGEDFFVPVVKEINGIEEVDNDIKEELDGIGSMAIYDLQGRKVNNPRPGTIYIMNGKKVLFK